MPASSSSRRQRASSPSRVQQPYHPSKHFAFAKRTLRKLVEDSQFFIGLNEENNVGTIHETEVMVGKLLGQGGFCEVRYCAAAKSKRSNNSHDHLRSEIGTAEAEESSASSDPTAYYAIKYLSPSRTANHPSDPKNKVFQRGIADLAMEACFLSLLRHENIITCHYVSEGSLEENFNIRSSSNNTEGDAATAGNSGNNVGAKKQKFREEVMSDAHGKLVVREVPIPEDEEGGEGENEEPTTTTTTAVVEQQPYKHRFGYFLLLDVLHETLAHRIDHSYIPQILLSNNGNHYSSDLTNSLLHMQEKRESFLKRITPKRPSLFQKHSSKDYSNHSSSSSIMTQPTTPNNNNDCRDIISQQKQYLAQRLTSLLSIANALQYLHEHQILFRDIKPDNIGFYRDYSSRCTCGKRPSTATTSEGGGGTTSTTTKSRCTCFVEIPKLFDFGLAKELKSKYKVESSDRHPLGNSRDYSENREYAHHHRKGRLSLSSRSIGSRIGDEERNAVYKLTGCTGSRRYMAPEVCFGDPYNEKADVYSFGMMLYQVASLVTPFDGYTSYDHEKQVLRGGFRPDIDIPTKKDFVTCRKLEADLFEELENGVIVPDDDMPEGLPPPSEKRNEILAIKSKSLWTKDLKRLIYECWDYDMRYRPTMKEVVVRLQGCIDELTEVQQQQQKKGRDSFVEMNNIDVGRGSRNTADNDMLHRQEGNGEKTTNIRGGVSLVEIQSNVSEGRESIKKKSFFRTSRSQKRESGAAVAAEIQQ